MNIAVRVTTVGAQQLTAMQQKLTSMQAASRTSSLPSLAPQLQANQRAAQQYQQAIQGVGNSSDQATSKLANFGESLRNANNRLGSFGKNLQWTGQQLTMRFTLPIAAAFAIGTHAIFENEKAMTRLRKVYDGFRADQAEQELAVLNEISLLLSNRFGVAREEVSETMAAFAQAGAKGSSVALLTKQAMELSILADMELADATQAVIVVQQQFRLSSQELHDSLAQLNVIENTTAVSTKDLLDSIQRAGPSAAASGTSIRELGALTAALVPMFGSGTRAGNALRSIFVRLTSDSKDVVKGIRDVIGAQNVQTFYTSTSHDQLRMLAEGYKNLDDTQKLYYAGQIAGTYQSGAFLQVMEQITTEQSAYNRALESTANIEAARDTYNKELQTAMESDPRRAQIALNQLRNSVAQFVAIAMPTIMQFLGLLQGLIKEFNELSPETRKWIMIVAIGLAVIGPLVSYLGSIILLVSTLLKPLAFLTVAFFKLVPAVLSAAASMWTFFLGNPYVLIAVAIGATILGLIAIFIIFRDDINAIFNRVWSDAERFIGGITGAFKELFSSIAGAVSAGLQAIGSLFTAGLTAIARVVAGAVKIIYELLSYLNPFARHSPSLVEEVDAGIDAIVAKYGELDAVSGPLRRAAGDMRAFKEATAQVREYLEAAEIGEQREAVGKMSPDALPAFDNLVGSLQGLRDQLPEVSAAIMQQEDVVRTYEQSLESLEAQIDAEESALSDMEKVLSTIGDELQAAKDRLNDYANTPIQGTQAFSDAIFDNEMKIKQLRLELMKLEDANPQLEDLTDQFEALNGAIEEVRGREKELRLAGAGSDVLGPLQDQVREMEAARNAMMEGGTAEGPAGEMEALRKEIERLEREGQRLDLEESLQFDPLRRQIEQLVNGMHELPFDEIVAGIEREQMNVARLTFQYDQQEAAVERQREVIAGLNKDRDALSKQLDAERDKLNALKQVYSEIEQGIRNIEQELAGWVQLAESAARAAAGAADEMARATGDLEDAFGSGIDMAEGGLEDLERLRDELQAQAEQGIADFTAKIDEWKNRLKGWWDEVIDHLRGVGDWLWRWVVGPAILPFTSFAQAVRGFYETITSWISLVIDLFVKLPGQILSTLVEFPAKMLDQGVKIMEGLFWGLGTTFGKLFDWAMTIPGLIIGIFEGAGGWLIEKGEAILNGMWWGLGVIWGNFWGWFSGLPDEIIGLFTGAGDWLLHAGEEIVRGLWNGIKNAPFDIGGAILDKLPNIPGVDKGHILDPWKQANHAGGVAGLDAAQAIFRPGGLRSDEYMRVLKRGESVLTPGQMQALGSMIAAPQSGGGDINIYGDISLPNISSGEDAQEFIDNLKALSR